MSIEAMKQALEALEFAAGLISPITKGCQCQICLAHKALRQAIEQAEKPKTRPATREEKIVNPGVYEVAVHASDISQERVDETAKDRHEWVEMQCPCGHKMYVKYTGREWVGLTDEEFKFIVSKYSLPTQTGMEYFKDELEAKLKEKNT